MKIYLINIFIIILLLINFLYTYNSNAQIHTWEMQEIVLHAEQEYDNYYTDVTCWVVIFIKLE